jgi:hypothetical protein
VPRSGRAHIQLAYSTKQAVRDPCPLAAAEMKVACPHILVAAMVLLLLSAASAMKTKQVRLFMPVLGCLAFCRPPLLRLPRSVHGVISGSNATTLWECGCHSCCHRSCSGKRSAQRNCPVIQHCSVVGCSPLPPLHTTCCL